MYCAAGSVSWGCGRVWTEVPNRTGVTHSLFRGCPTGRGFFQVKTFFHLSPQFPHTVLLEVVSTRLSVGDLSVFSFIQLSLGLVSTDAKKVVWVNQDSYETKNSKAAIAPSRSANR